MRRLFICLFFLCLSTLSLAKSPVLFQLEAKNKNFDLISDESPFVRMNSHTLKLNSEITNLRQWSQVSLTLPEGFSITVNRLRVESSDYADFIWVGRVEGDVHSIVSLAVKGDILVGEIFAGGKNYRIQEESENSFMISSAQLNKNFKLPEDIYNGEPREEGRAVVSEPSSDNFVDVIIGYTSEAAGGNIEATIAAMVTATNQMLADSCVNFRYRLLSVIATGVATGTDDGYAILNDLINTGGSYSALHTARTNQGADLVHLIVNTSSIGLCGLANLGGISGIFDDTRGFGLTALACPSFVLAHELGHNLSLRHDRYQQDLQLNESAPGGEHYGFVDTVNKYESIMSYQDHCIENGTFCQRMNKFSSPRISHNGVAFGIDLFADNADALNRSYPYVANYRASMSPFTPDINPNCATSDANKDLHCFVATATYGSVLHPKIKVLRDFRDNVLRKFALGRSLVKFYYKHSPRWAEGVRKNTWLKPLLLLVIGSVVFAVQYFPLIFFLGLVWFFRKRLLYIFLLVSFLPYGYEAQAFVSVAPKDQSLIPTNPSLSQYDSGKSHMGLSANLLSSKGEPDRLSSQEESGTAFDLYAGYRGTSFMFNFRYRPEWERKTKTQIRPLAATEVSEKSDLILLDTSFMSFFSLPLGMRLTHQTRKSFNANQLQTNEVKNLGVNFGSRMQLSSFILGGGLVYNMDSKTDLVSSNPKVSANWLSLYASVGLDFNNAGGTGGSFGAPSTGDGLSDGFQAEISYLRDPQVLEVDGSNQLVYPERSEFAGTLQYIASSFLMSLRYQTVSFAVVENFITEKSQFDQITVGLGHDMSSLSFNSNLYIKNEKTGFKKREIGFGLSMTYNFSASGDYGSSSFGY